MPQSGLLADRRAVVDRERQWCGDGEHLEVVRHHLDLARGEVGVLVALRALVHRAGDLDAVLVAQRMGYGSVMDDHLGDAAGIAQVEERDAAMVTTGRYPAGQRDGRTGVGCPEVACIVRANHHASFRSKYCSATA